MGAGPHRSRLLAKLNHGLLSRLLLIHNWLVNVDAIWSVSIPHERDQTARLDLAVQVVFFVHLGLAEQGQVLRLLNAIVALLPPVGQLHLV